MTSIITRILSLFSGGGESKPDAKQEMREFDDCRIIAAPINEGSQFRLAGRIEKDVDGQVLVRNFVRADVFTNRDDIVESTFRKGEQIIKQSGKALFSDGVEQRQV